MLQRSALPDRDTSKEARQAFQHDAAPTPKAVGKRFIECAFVFFYARVKRVDEAFAARPCRTTTKASRLSCHRAQVFDH